MTTYSYADGQVTVHQSPAEQVLPTMPAGSVDAVVCDPPYELGFMGRAWDRSGVAYSVDVWREVFRLLKPGGHLLAFGGTRTVHRMTCAIEDAGFEIRDGIDWLYGQGYPKSLDVAKAIDKAGGESPERQAQVLRTARLRAGLTVEQVAAAVGCQPTSIRNWEDGRARAAGRAVEHITPSPKYRAKLADLLGYTADERTITGTAGDRRGDGSVLGLGHSGVRYGGPVTEAAHRWAGWGTALKPAREPIVVARKPLAGTVAANVLAHGTGALNVDGCRVGSEARTNPAGGASSLQRVSRVEQGYRPTVTASVGEASSVAGRWPTNVALSHAATPDGADLCAGGCVDGCPVAELDRQSGNLTSGVLAPHHNAKPSANASMSGGNYEGGIKGTFGGDSGGASRFFPVFRYEAKAPTAERPRTKDGAAHATVKPLALMRWLVRMVTPPGGTVLDWCAGTGTTAEACLIEGFRCVAIEKEAAHLPLIEARLAKPIQPALDIFGAAS